MAMGDAPPPAVPASTWQVTGQLEGQEFNAQHQLVSRCADNLHHRARSSGDRVRSPGAIQPGQGAGDGGSAGGADGCGRWLKRRRLTVPIALGVADLAAIAAAGIALVPLRAMRTLAKPLGRWLANSVPLIGGAFSRGLDAGVNFAVAQSQIWLDAALTPLISVIMWIPENLGPWADQIWATFSATGGEIWNIRYNVLAAVRADYQLVIATIAYNLQSNINAVDNSGQALTHSLFATAEADIVAGVANAARYAEQVGAGVLATAEAGVSTAEALAVAEVAQLAQVVASDQQMLESLVTGGLAGAEAKIAQTLTDAQAYANQEATSVRDWAQKNEAALPGALGVGIAGVIAQVGMVAAELTQFRQTCGDPLCSNLGQFGQDLSALGGYIESGALFALLAAFIADPKGTAGVIEGIVTPMAQAVDTGLKAVVGLGA